MYVEISRKLLTLSETTKKTNKLIQFMDTAMKWLVYITCVHCGLIRCQQTHCKEQYSTKYEINRNNIHKMSIATYIQVQLNSLNTNLKVNHHEGFKYILDTLQCVM